ncbi:hypothetical protein AB0L00_23525 [Actinoallomurus sp. NPDC052308]
MDNRQPKSDDQPKQVGKPSREEIDDLPARTRRPRQTPDREPRS